jgi:hypothetical protein
MNENRIAKRWLLVALGAAAVVPFGVACGGGSNNPPPNTAGTASAGMVAQGQPPPGYPGAPPPGYPGAQPQPGYPAAQPGYPPQQPGYPPAAQPQPGYPAPAQPGTQPAPAGSQTPPGPLAPTDPNSLQGILQGLGTALQGTVVPGGALGGDLTDVGLKTYALKVAPGMQPEGDELKQNLAQGQHAVMMVTLQAGKCYTLIGFSAPGAVKDLDLNLLAPPLYMTLAGQDLTHNNTPAIGAAPSPMCPVIAFPLQYKLDVFARDGSGMVAAQLYSKTK